MIKRNIGGDRLGSGAKMNVEMHGYGRSTHDLSYNWKSTMSAGTLVPFMTLLALPGDTFDIDLNALCKTLPTIGPLFGSFKLQLDVFFVPIRLFNRLLHNNTLGIGLSMVDVYFPFMTIEGKNLNFSNGIPIENQQINQSSILAYLGIRGIARSKAEPAVYMDRRFNAMPLLSYWEIFKNYYANKQEDNAYVIHAAAPNLGFILIDAAAPPSAAITAGRTINIVVQGTNVSPENIQVQLSTSGWTNLLDLGANNVINTQIAGEVFGVDISEFKTPYIGQTIDAGRLNPNFDYSLVKPTLNEFALTDIDDMRTYLMTQGQGVDIGSIAYLPYSLLLTHADHVSPAINSQEGLAVKTYQSDLFNNWINTEWIDGVDGISAITAINTEEGSFTIDTLNLSKKVYDFLNRIAIAGGTYEDYIETVYDVKSNWKPEKPVFHGGLAKDVVFQEVISNAATQDDPLGSLAGKGIMSDTHRGGKVIINCDEAGYIMGIVSLTPRISYSQGNEWHVNLKSMDDLHKPALDGIGYQDLITDQMHFADTIIDVIEEIPVFKSAGKQPAWLNYMTNYDKAYGGFADARSQKFMTLDRNYEVDILGISDLTTYIDPTKFNYAFAQTDLTSQNFWMQIACKIEARRKISGKIIPNL